MEDCGLTHVARAVDVGRVAVGAEALLVAVGQHLDDHSVGTEARATLQKKRKKTVQSKTSLISSRCVPTFHRVFLG